MRFFAFAALAALSIGLFDARPASAASWSCVGPEVACGGARSTAKKASYKKAAYKKEYKKTASHRAHKATRSASAERRATKKVASSGSYGGGSSGIASYYWQGQMTASGARFNPGAMTAAHRTLPFGTRVLVTNQSNGRTVTVTINDRGPFVKGRIIDLSKAAAGAIGMTGQGLARVSVSVLGKG
jgi:rare lipoprotein A